MEKESVENNNSKRVEKHEFNMMLVLCASLSVLRMPGQASPKFDACVVNVHAGACLHCVSLSVLRMPGQASTKSDACVVNVQAGACLDEGQHHINATRIGIVNKVTLALQPLWLNTRPHLWWHLRSA